MQAQVSKLFQSIRLQHGKTPPAVLRKGQFITGKVIRFFPEHKAMVQLGGKAIVAHLERALQANQRYVFHVKDISPYIHLKVISEKPVQKEMDQVAHILAKLGLKAGKFQKQLVSMLFREQIPIQKDELKQAFILVNRSSSFEKGASVLLEMMKRKLPMTRDVFDSLYARMFQQKSLTKMVSELRLVLHEQPDLTNEGFQLYRSLAAFSQVKNSVTLQHHWMGQLLAEAQTSDRTTFSFLQKAGIISKNKTYSSWQETLLNWAKQQGYIDADGKLNAKTVLSSHIPLSESPLSFLTDKKFDSTFQLLSHHGNAPEQADVKHILNMLQSARTNHQVIKRLLTSSTLLKVFDQLSPDLQKEIQGMRIKMDSTDAKQIQSLISRMEGEVQALLEQTWSPKHKQVLQYWQFIHSLYSQGNTGKQFFTGIQGLLSLLTPNLELEGTYPSLTGLLSSVANQTKDAPIKSQTQQLLQVLNGLLLSTIQDQTDPYRQFSLQIPGEIFGLKEDVVMDFEGKGDEKGNLEPAFCRIMFYLSMPHLKETVIDMNVQNKTVGLTVYHPNPDLLTPVVSNLKPSLQDGLKKQNYHLSSIVVKSLQVHRKAHKNPEPLSPRRIPDQGLDVKI